LPQDINATITVVPFSKDYVAKDVFTIESEELNKRLFVGLDEKISEYFAEHEFNLEKTGSNEDDKYILYDDVKPTYAYEGDLGGEEDYEIKEAKEDEDFLNSLIDSGSKKESKNNSFGFFNFISLLIKLGLIVLFCVFGYFYFKKPEFKKKSNIFFKKAWEFTKKKYNEFIKYAKPRVLKISKWLWEKSVIAYNWILHNSKKVYHKAKPHVEKAHQSIKKKVKVIKNKKKHNNK
jgi:hypothetical protein